MVDGAPSIWKGQLLNQHFTFPPPLCLPLSLSAQTDTGSVRDPNMLTSEARGNFITLSLSKREITVIQLLQSPEHVGRSIHFMCERKSQWAEGRVDVNCKGWRHNDLVIYWSSNINTWVVNSLYTPSHRLVQLHRFLSICVCISK